MRTAIVEQDSQDLHAHSACMQPLLAQADVHNYQTGQCIIAEGKADTSLYVLLKGRVRVYCDNENGKELILDTLSEGQIFGEMALDGGPRSASVVALQTCQCACMSIAQVQNHMRQNPNFAVQLLHLVIARARSANQKAKDMALSDAYARLAKTLTHWAGDARRISPKLTHATLAQMVGTSREMVSKLMKDLEKGGYVQNLPGSLLLRKRLPAKW